MGIFKGIFTLCAKKCNVWLVRRFEVYVTVFSMIGVLVLLSVLLLDYEKLQILQKSCLTLIKLTKVLDFSNFIPVSELISGIVKFGLLFLLCNMDETLETKILLRQRIVSLKLAGFDCYTMFNTRRWLFLLFIWCCWLVPPRKSDRHTCAYLLKKKVALAHIESSWGRAQAPLLLYLLTIIVSLKSYFSCHNLALCIIHAICLHWLGHLHIWMEYAIVSGLFILWKMKCVRLAPVLWMDRYSRSISVNGVLLSTY